MRTLVSVIVPVYNSEKYLERCIESIRNQTLKEIEMIFINDGSSDGSLDILKQYEKIDDRIKVIDQKNSGPSAARNRGIRHSKGEYITFVDADDYIEVDMYEKMFNEGYNYDAQLVICDYWECKDKKYYGRSMNNDLYQYDKEDINKIIIKELLTNSTINSLWNKLFSRDIILKNNIMLNEDLFYAEDWLFIFEFCLNINKIRYIKEGLYNYVRGHESLSNSYGEETFEITGLWIYRKRKEFAKKLNLYEYSGSRELFNVLTHCIIQESNKRNISIGNKISKLKYLLENSEVNEILPIIKQSSSGINKIIFLYLIKYKLYFMLIVYSKLAKIKCKLIR